MRKASPIILLLCIILLFPSIIQSDTEKIDVYKISGFYQHHIGPEPGQNKGYGSILLRHQGKLINLRGFSATINNKKTTLEESGNILSANNIPWSRGAEAGIIKVYKNSTRLNTSTFNTPIITASIPVPRPVKVHLKTGDVVKLYQGQSLKISWDPVPASERILLVITQDGQIIFDGQPNKRQEMTIANNKFKSNRECLIIFVQIYKSSMATLTGAYDPSTSYYQSSVWQKFKITVMKTSSRGSIRKR